MIYNKTALEEAGVAVPQSEDEIWTWDEFTEAAKTVVEKTDCQYGLAFDKTQRRYQVLMYQFGASVVNNDGTAVVANSPESVGALEYFIQLHEDGVMPKSVFLGTEDPSALFKSGQLAAAIQGSWKISDYTENITDFEWGVTYMPIGTQRANRLGGNFFCAIKDSGKEEQAKEFLKWFYDCLLYTSHPNANTQRSTDDIKLHRAIVDYNRENCLPGCMMILGTDNFSIFIDE